MRWLLPYLVLLSLCSCEVLQVKETVVYKDVPVNTIVLNGTEYSMDTFMVVRRSTYLGVWDKLVERDNQLRECLEREKGN
jgi:hypothetical protein